MRLFSSLGFAAMLLLTVAACEDAALSGSGTKSKAPATKGDAGGSGDDETSGSGSTAGKSGSGGTTGAAGGTGAGKGSGAGGSSTVAPNVPGGGDQGDGATIESTLSPGGATNVEKLLASGSPKATSGESKDPSTVSFDPATGEIKAVAPGQATVVVTLADGTTRSFLITVTDAASADNPCSAQFVADFAEIANLVPTGMIGDCGEVVSGKTAFAATSGCQRFCAAKGFQVGYMSECNGGEQKVACQCAGTATNDCAAVEVVPMTQLQATVPAAALTSCAPTISSPQNFAGTSACNRFCSNSGFLGGFMTECNGQESPEKAACGCAKKDGTASIEIVDVAALFALVPTAALPTSCDGAVAGSASFPANSACSRYCIDTKGKSMGRMIECNGDELKAACLCL